MKKQLFTLGFIVLSFFTARADLTNGLVGYYQLNGDANDASGHGNSGTGNQVDWVVDRFGVNSGAASFTSGISYITAPTSPTLDIDGQITISAWIKPTSARKAVITKGNVGSFWEYGLSAGINGFGYEKTSGGAGPQGLSLTSNGWSQVVVAINESANQMRFYLNGQFVTNQAMTLSGGFDTTDVSNVISDSGDHGTLYIGNNNVGGSPANFDGALDDVRIYNRALNSTEVAELFTMEAAAPSIITGPAAATVLVGQDATMSVSAVGAAQLAYQWLKDGTNLVSATNSSLNLSNCQVADSGQYSVLVTNAYGSVTSAPATLRIVTNSFDLGLVAYYPFNGNAQDESGNHRSLDNSGASLITNRFRAPDSAYSFNGLSSILIQTNSDSLVLHDQFTISCWVNIPAFNFNFYSLVRKDGDASILIINTESNSFCVEAFANGRQYRAFAHAPPTNSWCMLTATWDGTMFKQYFNGNLAPSIQDDFSRTVASAPISLGGSTFFPGQVLLGAMDDVRIYNRPLSGQEVSQLYDAEFPDVDRDGLSDYEEINVYHTDPNKRDTDGDGLSDFQEALIYHTDPLKADTDGDGFNDYAEIYSGHDPLSVSDFPAANLNIFTAIELEFIAKTNAAYFIQASPDLSTWTNFEGPITGDGNIWKKTYSTRGSSKLYYRVELAP